MDLDHCPRCGSKWSGGDFCPNCKFVPIGAGLKHVPKKKKRKAKYVEPGSSRGLFSFVLVGLLGFGAYRYQPWKDDWEIVRAMFGKGRHHSLVGEWEVVKTVAVAKQQGFVARDSVQKGMMKFSDKGLVTMNLVHSESETDASGMYKVDGITVAMEGLRSTGDASDPIPTSVNMNLAWVGNDNVIAMDKTEAIYLHRRKTTGNGSLLKFMQMGLRKGEKPDAGQAPAEMRGVIGDMKRSIQDNEDFANNN